MLASKPCLQCQDVIALAVDDLCGNVFRFFTYFEGKANVPRKAAANINQAMSSIVSMWRLPSESRTSDAGQPWQTNCHHPPCQGVAVSYRSRGIVASSGRRREYGSAQPVERTHLQHEGPPLHGQYSSEPAPYSPFRPSVRALSRAMSALAFSTAFRPRSSNGSYQGCVTRQVILPLSGGSGNAPRS